MNFFPITTKEMANGQRNQELLPLTDVEISEVLDAIHRIEADLSVFIFNDPKHVESPFLGTGYNPDDDIIYITKNVLPDTRYASTHPRDIMSIAAVLAHEYYGHRTFRQEYLDDEINGTITTPEWQDECRASIVASQITPNLTDSERRDLVLDAVYRAREYGQYMEMDDYMKEIIYGHYKYDKNITISSLKSIKYISERSIDGVYQNEGSQDYMPEMSDSSEDIYER